MIKAIQTVYKGYKFRSRLEARWAVFFDALGLEWEYEPEGFDLGDGVWYLPDFRVKVRDKFYSDVFFEIKAKNNFTPSIVKRSVYLAGKISKKDDKYSLDHWRRSIADECYLGNKHEFDSAFQCDTPKQNNFKHGFTYCGPHFSCNHGTYVEHQRALKQIDLCDVFFAWVNSSDAYGTFSEIGYAKAKGKKIYIGYSDQVLSDDMWFLSEMACSHGVFHNAKEAFNSLVLTYESSCLDELKVSLLSRKSRWAPVVLSCGDPLDVDLWIYESGFGKETNFNFFMDKIDKPDIYDAATKARQARFEHGETPL
jgi:nucleoside 2-deoxyribosyltransferase